MSFILDALRKSEHERRRGALPSVAQIPYALPRARLPFWVPVAIAVLAVALVATGFAWWYTARPAAGGAQRLAANALSPPEGLRPAETPGPRPATQSAPSEPAPLPQTQSGGSPAWGSPPRTGDPPPWSPPATELRAQAVAPSNAALEAPAAQSAMSRADVPAPTLSDDALPSASALASAGIVPPLTLHLLVYDADAAKRFVIINSRRYSEGNYVAEGPQLVRITDRGAVLRQQSREFLLVPE